MLSKCAFISPRVQCSIDRSDSFSANYEKALQIYGGNAEYLQEIARTMYCRGLNFEKLLKNPEAELWLDKALTLMRQVAGQTWIPVQGKKSHDEMVNF